MIIFIIVFLWIYYLFISPKIFSSISIIVPNIINLSEEEGLELLTNNDIKYKVSYVENSNNQVIKTIPYPNTKIKKNYEVEVYVGKVMPASYSSFLGQVFKDVKNEIELFCNNNGIKLKVVYENNDYYLDGVIIRESINHKQTLEGIEELIITISSNDSKLTMPNFVGKHINSVIEFVDKHDISVIFIYLEVLMEEDIVLYQSISENTIIDKNTKYEIEIYVSKTIT